MSDFIREAVTVSLKRREPARPLAELAGKYRRLRAEPLKPHDAAWAKAIR